MPGETSFMASRRPAICNVSMLLLEVLAVPVPCPCLRPCSLDLDAAERVMAPRGPDVMTRGAVLVPRCLGYFLPGTDPDSGPDLDALPPPPPLVEPESESELGRCR